MAKLHHEADYREARRKSYPDLSEAIDALVHKELGNPQLWRDYVAKCADVKKRIPKPRTTNG